MKSHQSTSDAKPRSRWVRRGLYVALAVMLGLLAWQSWQPQASIPQPPIPTQPITIAQPQPTIAPAPEIVPQSFKELLSLSRDKLARVDVARMNMLCVEGLPGTSQLNLSPHLATLNHWAKRVASETDKYFFKYLNNPAEFNHSEPYYRMMMLVTVLQQDFKVHYNPDRIYAPDFSNPDDLFINSLMLGKGGTCSSLPVFYLAVARRLGYLVKLVSAKAHLFCRWDGLDSLIPSFRERFNLEMTNQGLTVHDDAYYRTWPIPFTDAEQQANQYLKSLDAHEMLAIFCAQRGMCFHANGHIAIAASAFWNADQVNPQCITYQQQALALIDQANSHTVQRQLHVTDDVNLINAINAWNMKHPNQRVAGFEKEFLHEPFMKYYRAEMSKMGMLAPLPGMNQGMYR